MAKHAEEVEKRPHNSMKPDAETTNRPTSSRETCRKPPGDAPRQTDTPQVSHTERPLEEPWNMRGGLPAGRQETYLDTNILSHYSAEDPNCPYTTQLVQNLKTQSASPPASSTHKSHEKSSQSLVAAVAHMPNHTPASSRQTAQQPTTRKRPCGSHTLRPKTIYVVYAPHLAEKRRIPPQRWTKKSRDVESG
jgi:hypothetical protein